MTLRDLEIFCAVCDANNMTTAAEKLYISQSSISQVISNIEKEFGVKLFERYSKKLYITESGRILQDYAKHVLLSFNEMQDKLRGYGIIKVIHVGASVTIGTQLLPEITKIFSEIQPDVKIQAFVGNTSIVEEKILKNDLDLALIEGNVYSPHIISKPFLDDELVLVCGRANPLYNKNSIGKKELSNLPYIVRESGSGTRELFDRVMNANEITWEPIWVCNNTEGIKNAVIAGIGVTVISRLLIKKELQNGDLHAINIENIDFKRKFKMIYHRNKYISEPIRKLMELVFANYATITEK